MFAPMVSIFKEKLAAKNAKSPSGKSANKFLIFCNILSFTKRYSRDTSGTKLVDRVISFYALTIFGINILVA